MSKVNLKKSMETLTKTTTKVVSSTALIVATFALFGAGAIALATAPVAKSAGGSSTVKVYSCKKAKSGVLIKVNSRSKTTSLVNGCKKIGQTKRDYTYTCASNRRSYKAKWVSCATKTVVEKVVTEETSNPTTDAVVPTTIENLPDLAIEDVQFSANYGQVKITLANKGQVASTDIEIDGNANPSDESGLRAVWQDINGKQLSASATYVTSLKAGEKRIYTLDSAGGNNAELDHVLILVDKTNKIKEIIEEENNVFLEKLKAPLIVINCEDPDAKTIYDYGQLYTKSAVKVKGVEQKEDYCVGNYLFEGICVNDIHQGWQQNCAELNVGKETNDFKCEEGICVNKYVEPTVVLSDLDLVFRTAGTNGIEIPVAASPKVVRAVYGFNGTTTNAKLNVPEDTNIFKAYFIQEGNVYVKDGIKITFLDEGKNELGQYLVDLDATAGARASSINLPNNPKIKFVRVYLDVDNKIAETNENNNISEREVSPALFSLSDIIFSGGITISVGAGPRTVQVHYLNLGKADSLWAQNGIKFSFLDVNKTEVAKVLVDMEALSVNNIQAKLATANLPIDPAIKYVRVYLDAFADNYELNETNNVLERGL